MVGQNINASTVKEPSHPAFLLEGKERIIWTESAEWVVPFLSARYSLGDIFVVEVAIGRFLLKAVFIVIIVNVLFDVLAKLLLVELQVRVLFVGLSLAPLVADHNADRNQEQRQPGEDAQEDHQQPLCILLHYITNKPDSGGWLPSLLRCEGVQYLLEE